MRTIGIIGGGQLGLMIAEQARMLGARTVCLDPSHDAPAFAVCDDHITAKFDDCEALEEFRPLFDSQDRLREKDNARSHGLSCPHYRDITSADDLHKAVGEFGYPCVLKTRTLGYDGYGQCLLRSAEDLPSAEKMLSVPCILEEFVRFDYEASIIMVGEGDNIVSFPIGRNIHSKGILDLSIVPAPEMGDDVRRRMEEQSVRFMRDCGYRGILAIEYFVRGDDILFNEMAPRPHNSGHYTIEGCTTNQFRELCRYLLDMPLERPELKAPTVMKNILGRDLEEAEKIAAEGHPNVYVHIYGAYNLRRNDTRRVRARLERPLRP